MFPAHSDLVEALEALPLFPLQQAVLFPGARMPLRVFEPRYRRMIRDVLSSHRTLSIVNVADLDAEMEASPTIPEVAGIGTIVEHMELPGGRFNIVVLGRGRVRLEELSFVPPYRRARATLLETDEAAVPALDMAAFHAAMSAFVAVVRERDASFRVRLPKDAPPGSLADACAAQLVLDARERQALLETCDAARRVRRLVEVLTVQRAMIAPEADAGSVN